MKKRLFFFLCGVVWTIPLLAQEECIGQQQAEAVIWRVDPGCVAGLYSYDAAAFTLFAKGNLQFRLSDPALPVNLDQYRLASNQGYYISQTINLRTDTFGLWTDLFTWRADYGTAPILRAGDTPELWRMLTPDEWAYVLARTDADGRLLYAYAKVTTRIESSVGVEEDKVMNGLLLLPDHGELPAGISLSQRGACAYAANAFLGNQWAQMEAAGCVFLPALGYMEGETLQDFNTHGYYWTPNDESEGAYCLSFIENTAPGCVAFAKTLRLPVRLIRHYEPSEVR